MRFILLVVSLVNICAWQTFAEAKKVYSPIVIQGDIEVETQTDVVRTKTLSNKGSKHQIEVSYAALDWWRSGIYMVYNKNNNSVLRHTQNKWANIFQITEQGKYWVDVGLYAEYIWSALTPVQPSILEFKVLLEKPVKDWKHTLNVVFEKPATSSVVALGYAWRSRYKTNVGLELGVESYGRIGTLNRVQLSRKNHLIGPVLDYEVADALEVSLGWLMSTRDGPGYGSLKLNLEYKF